MYEVWIWTKLRRKYISIPGASYKMKGIKIRTDFARAVRACIKRKKRLTWKIVPKYCSWEQKCEQNLKLNTKVNI